MERIWFMFACLAFAMPIRSEVNPGELLASACFACHGTDGTGQGNIPALDADAQEIRVKMTDFQDDDARATIMTRIARGYTEREIRLIADYLGSGH
jgi:sulfide dehydrogenase cytochrome subunit